MTVNRCLLVAAVALDLATLGCGDVVRVPGGTDGATFQIWDGLNAVAWAALANPSITIYTDLASIPLQYKKMLGRVKRYDDVTATPGAAWKRLADCTTLDFVKVTVASVPSVKTASTILATDRPSEWLALHEWAGKVGDTLGAA